MVNILTLMHIFREPSVNVERYKITAKLKRQALKQSRLTSQKKVDTESADPLVAKDSQITKTEPQIEEDQKTVLKSIDLCATEGEAGLEETTELPIFPKEDQSDLAQMMGQTIDERMPDPPAQSMDVSSIKPLHNRQDGQAVLHR